MSINDLRKSGPAPIFINPCISVSYNNIYKKLDFRGHSVIIIIMKTIDITPTWSALIIPMVEVLKNPKAPAEAKKEITDEFVRLAKIVDEYNEEAKQNG